MPKSMSTVRPSGCTIRLPPCRSPWKTPYNIAPSMNDDEPGVQHRFGVDAGVVHRGDVVPRDAASRSITSTRRVTSVRVRAGDEQSRADSVSASTLAMSSMFSASRRKSSSSTIVSANSSTSAGGLASAAIGMRPVSRGASHAIASRSWRTSSRDLRPLHLDDDFLAGAQPGRVHLRDRRGRDRRAVEADEHVVERAAELHLDDPPHVVERPRRGTRSRSSLNSATSSAGNSPSPPEMIWPSLM